MSDLNIELISNIAAQLTEKYPHLDVAMSPRRYIVENSRSYHAATMDVYPLGTQNGFGRQICSVELHDGIIKLSIPELSDRKNVETTFDVGNEPVVCFASLSNNKIERYDLADPKSIGMLIDRIGALNTANVPDGLGRILLEGDRYVKCGIVNINLNSNT